MTQDNGWDDPLATDQLSRPGLYRHWKGNYYRVICTAHEVSVGSKLVIYTSASIAKHHPPIELQDRTNFNPNEPTVFAREVEEFTSILTDDELVRAPSWVKPGTRRFTWVAP